MTERTRPQEPTVSLGAHADAVTDAVTRLESDNVVSRILVSDYSVWRTDPTEITDRLGWLTVIAKMRDEVRGLRRFANEVRDDGIRHVVLLGMGGSSLGPEVIPRSHCPRLHPSQGHHRRRQPDRPGPHALPRLLQVRRHHRAQLPVQALPRCRRGRRGEGRPRRSLRRHHRPGHLARRSRRRRRLQAPLRKPARHRRTLFRPLLLWPGARRTDRRGRRPPLGQR